MDVTTDLAVAWLTFQGLCADALRTEWAQVAMKFFPFVVIFELPVQAAVMLGTVRYWLRLNQPGARQASFHPPVSCIITCYSEGDDVRKTIDSLTEQLYPGHIEMLAVVDGAHQNRRTADAVRAMLGVVNSRPRRRLELVAKTQRGGRVSSLNQGLAIARGSIVMALDGDTSFDNDMVRNAVRHFTDPNVVAVSGNLRVRNAFKTLTTRLQALEYMLSIHLSRTGLNEFNAVNNISGAFGIFRRDFLRHIGGWDSGTAEDLDLTLRIKKYFARHPAMRILFEPRAMGHTDAPEAFGQFLNQRLRWDGDLSYLYLRKYRDSLRPSLLGWTNFIAYLWTGLFFQLALPFVLLAYMSVVFLIYPPAFVLGTLAFVYAFYWLLTVAMYVEYLVLLSERPRHDLRFWWVTLLFPAFAFATRAWNAVSTLSEMFTRSHLDSSMAPWWVLRKTKY
jgi:cellulose synthase/poly-beta-1,6-N-acetylglucosamine synthase-like glycosyltransferase